MFFFKMLSVIRQLLKNKKIFLSPSACILYNTILDAVDKAEIQFETFIFFWKNCSIVLKTTVELVQRGKNQYLHKNNKVIKLLLYKIVKRIDFL